MNEQGMFWAIPYIAFTHIVFNTLPTLLIFKNPLQDRNNSQFINQQIIFKCDSSSHFDQECNFQKQDNQLCKTKQKNS